MKRFILWITLVFIAFQLKAEFITGKVIDSSTGEPLEYVNIGVTNTSIGTVSDKNGEFKIDVTKQPTNAIVRISMISYKSESYTIEQLIGHQNVVKLISSPVQLAEVIIRPSGKTRKVGTTNFSRLHGVCGLSIDSGSVYGTGYEIGIKLELGDKLIQLKNLGLRLKRQAFDSTYFRLHIRSIKDNKPDSELLSKNIIFPLTKELGWEEVNLSKYNIILKGDVILSVEWVRVVGKNPKRAMKIKEKISDNYVLFNNGRKKEPVFIK